MEIYDKSGNVIASSVPPESRNFDNMTIRNAWIVDLELEGMSFSRSDLSGWEFTGSDLYGSILIETNMSQCKMQGVDLRSSYIDEVCFRGADLRNARFSRDELGGGLTLHAADFTDANLEGADFSGSKYDAATIFLEGFDPVQKGMIKLEDWEREHRPRAANS
jgi:uncharacterized protein YjbI with pentapeptide repeats